LPFAPDGGRVVDDVEALVTLAERVAALWVRTLSVGRDELGPGGVSLLWSPITTTLLPHARSIPLLPPNRCTRSPISASCSRALRTSILANRVCASLNNRYASCWCTGNPSPSAACACAGAIAGRRGSPSVVVLCSPAVGCRVGVYQVVTGTGPGELPPSVGC
jgi:hypothetical protein